MSDVSEETMVGYIDHGGLGMDTIHEESTDRHSETASHIGLQAAWILNDARSAAGDSEVGTARADIFDDREQRLTTVTLPATTEPHRRTDSDPTQGCFNINWKIWILLGILVLAAAGAIYWIVSAVSAKQSSAQASSAEAPSMSPARIGSDDDFWPTDRPSTPSMSPSVTLTADLEELQTFLATNVSIEVLEGSTAYYQTWNWFAHEDPLQMRVGVDDDWRIIQRFLLAHLFFSLDGENWSIDGFLTEEGECDWTGVRCDRAKVTVKGIDIHDAKLAGSLPSEFSQLSGIEWLVFSNNSLTGTIPEAWWNFEKLKLLNLSANEITGQLSPRLWKLTSLLSLDVDDNRLTGEIPEVSDDSSHLKLLKADSNLLNGTLPASLWNLHNMTHLSFKYNNLTGELPIVPEGRSIALQALFLDHNKMQGSLPPSIGMDALGSCSNHVALRLSLLLS